MTDWILEFSEVCFGDWVVGMFEVVDVGFSVDWDGGLDLCPVSDFCLVEL